MNRLQLIIIIAIFVAPALKQIWDKAKARAEIERRKRDTERSHTETLRTGRAREQRAQPAPQARATIDAGAAGADRSRVQQLEAERQRRLNELRRVAQQRAQGARAGSGSPASPQQQPARQPRARAQPRRQPGPSPSARQPTRARAYPLTPTPATGTLAPVAAHGADRPAGDVVGLTSTGTVTSGRKPGVLLGRIGVDDLRRAMVMYEVLGPPVALRDRHLDESGRLS